MTGEAHPVRVEGLSGKAKRAVLAQPEGEESGLELELKAGEVVRLDVALV